MTKLPRRVNDLDAIFFVFLPWRDEAYASNLTICKGKGKLLAGLQSGAVDPVPGYTGVLRLEVDLFDLCDGGFWIICFT